MVVANTFLVLDFDRCLGNEKLYDLFDEVAADIIDIDVLKEARKQVERGGGSFDTFGWLRETLNLSDASMRQLSTAYTARADELGNQTFLSGGARELLIYLADNHIPHMIMTYGGREYQDLKIRAAGLQAVPRHIVDSKDKSGYISQWWNEDTKQFIIPSEIGDIVASTVMLIDDKPAAFTHLIPQARGYLIRDGKALLGFQIGQLPANVTECDDLFGVLDDINTSYHS